MTTEIKFISKFLVTLIVLLVLSYLTQSSFDYFKPDELLLMKSYWFNGLSSIIIFVGIILANRFQPRSSGFLFMAGSGLKFIFFFILFYSPYHADGIVQRDEFLSFFIPYSLSVICEVYFLVKKLNN
jgi:hypothetical protein